MKRPPIINDIHSTIKSEKRLKKNSVLHSTWMSPIMDPDNSCSDIDKKCSIAIIGALILAIMLITFVVFVSSMVSVNNPTIEEIKINKGTSTPYK